MLKQVPQKIGLAGRSGSGKDVIADHISDWYGYRKVAVADAIREECADFLHSGFQYWMDDCGFPASFKVVRDAFKAAIWEKPTSPQSRVMLQWWGTEYRRSGDPDCWTNILARKLDRSDRVVVSDVRTPEEMEVIRNAGGIVCLVERPGVQAVGISNHLTEYALAGATFDLVIHNDSSLEDLIDGIDQMMWFGIDDRISKWYAGSKAA